VLHAGGIVGAAGNPRRAGVPAAAWIGAPRYHQGVLRAGEVPAILMRGETVTPAGQAAGGNMIVLYNTQELVPNRFAPFPAENPRNSEEVSEEDSPVEILAPKHQAFTWPNAITAADFNGWVEQRGSKFFTSWDAAYTPMISTFDQGQAPQRGGWLTATYGKGTWTYFAYALHRQLPYGVPGAYRIAANLLALGKKP